MGRCLECDRSDVTVSEAIGLCRQCILSQSDSVNKCIAAKHQASRRIFGLPEKPPRDPEGLPCPLCVNQCSPSDGGRGYCAVRRIEKGRWVGVASDRAAVSWYHDPLPTNCVADWVCPAGTPAGHPEFTDTREPEYGYYNLAVFYEACTFNCLFCQNWHFRDERRARGVRTVSDLAEAVHERTRCICFFGGDPSAQLPHSLRSAYRAREQNQGRILRICWETNGSMAPGFLKPMARLALRSGGCIKFDLKAWSNPLHEAMCHVSNRQTLENFQGLWELMKERKDPPPLVASTLLVPGYVTPEEVGKIAHFIASLDKRIPYSLLAFHPQFFMQDLPKTSRAHAEAALDKAREAGLEHVRIGNDHLLDRE